ncbi:hypothetical protein [Thermus scotoductus]|uniref:hypothetical protein n=1 Tax=Thermus scotoductus TaxID=37636 RepID=UPI00068CB1B6|nr:hypothetical protein [Thermus scotoductus]
MLLVEHDLEYALAFADRVTVLHYGQVVAEGTPEAIQENPWSRKSTWGSLGKRLEETGPPPLPGPGSWRL